MPSSRLRLGMSVPSLTVLFVRKLVEKATKIRF